ncbi:MAG: aminoglycoside phosphotransferase family protein [Chitinophagaceae bacterium]|nr:aminoglycoside phosphotransferase family protein [Chitinophagaceae bacterium]
MQFDKILESFGITGHNVTSYGSGLINHTWVVENKKGEKIFILQRINELVFLHPADIAFNIRLIAKYLRYQTIPGSDIPGTQPIISIPLLTKYGNDLLQTNEGYFRVFSFLKNAHTIENVQTPHQAFEAAAQFGKFTKLLSGFDATQLKITLPDFHNLSLRFKQFEEALQTGNNERVERSKEIIDLILKHKDIVDEFEKIKSNPDFKTRVTHHDTKISNVLFDENDNGVWVIDLDTVMPGYFISDVGDMFRSYLSPVNEEEKDFSKIVIRKDYYQAIISGYLQEMDALTTTEQKYFLYAGKFMIYMQALRFITDHLNNDVYYGAKYEGHNFVRAGNQITLLQKLIEFEKLL